MDRCDMSSDMCDSIESSFVLRQNNTLYECLYIRNIIIIITTPTVLLHVNGLEGKCANRLFSVLSYHCVVFLCASMCCAELLLDIRAWDYGFDSCDVCLNLVNWLMSSYTSTRQAVRFNLDLRIYYLSWPRLPIDQQTNG